MLKFSTFNEHQAGRASTKSVVPSSPSLEFASPCRVHNQYPRDFERFWRPWTLRPVRKSSSRRQELGGANREQAARDESPSAASRLRDVRLVLGCVRGVAGVAPGRPQLPQGVGAQGGRAAARRAPPRTGPTVGRVSTRVPGLAGAPPDGPAPPPAARHATVDGRRSPSAPRGAAARRGRFRAPRRPRTSSSRATRTARLTRRRRPGAPRAARRRGRRRRARPPPAEPRRAATSLSSSPTASTRSPRATRTGRPARRGRPGAPDAARRRGRRRRAPIASPRTRRASVSTDCAADDLFVSRALQSHEVAFAAIACAIPRGGVDDVYFYVRTASADGASVRALVADGESARRIVARAALTSAPEPASCSTRSSGWAFGPAGSASGVEDPSARSARSRSGRGWCAKL